MELDWHAERSDLRDLALLDHDPPDVDMVALRAWRLRRLRAEMRRRDVAACVLFDPVNIRYATGARNMQVFHARNPSRYLLVTVDGPVILYEATRRPRQPDDAATVASALETLETVLHAAPPPPGVHPLLVHMENL
jgi:Xaa-Pro aminopeptidase